MSKRFFILLPIVILVSAAIAFALLSFLRKYNAPKHEHYHAGFQVYIDGKLQDFSGTKYMKKNPCTVDGVSHGQEDEQLEKAHLHDEVGNIVHSHRKSVYWKDLFTNIRYSLPQGKPIKSFVNGKVIESISEQKINPYDNVVIFVGDNKNEKAILKKAVTKDEILKVESKSENCGS